MATLEQRIDERKGRTPGPRRRGTRPAVTGLLFVAPFFLLYAVFLLWPLVRDIWLSFTNASLPGTGSSHFLGVQNYTQLFQDSAFWSSLWHTLWFAILTTPPLVVLGLVTALLANRAIPARWLFRLAFFGPYVLPVSVMAVIWVWLYEPGFGLVDTLLAHLGITGIGWLTDPTAAMPSIAVATVWWTLGFNFVLYLAGLQEIPQSLYRAAAVDGAGRWSTFWHVTFPGLRRTHVLVVILQVRASLKVFGQIYVMTAGGPNYATRPTLEYVYDMGFT